MINVIWLFLVGSAIIYSILSGKGSELTPSILASLQSGFSLIINMAPMIILWLGLMKLAEDSGLLEKFGKIIRPFLTRLFPSLKKNSKAIDYVASNIACNMLGMGSAATPFGLKAMQAMQEENSNKDVASEAMITFLVLNTTGLTLIPTTLISIRTLYKSINPTKIIVPCFLATLIATISGLVINKIVGKKYE